MAIISIISGIASAIAGAVSAVAGALGISSGLLTFTLGAAISIGSSFLRGRPKINASPAAQYQAVINQAAASRRRGYGRLRVGGVRAFYDSVNGVLHQIVMMHTGMVDGVETVYVGDEAVSLDTDTGVWTRSFAYGRFYAGSDVQTADGNMLAAWPGVWTSDHRLLGICYMHAAFTSPPIEQYLDIFPEGAQTPITAVLRLSRCYDPRTDTTVWTENPALQIADYLTHPDGYRDMTADDLDWDWVAAMADLYDQAAPLAAGGTEPLFRCSLMYELTDDPADVLPRFLAACDAELFTTSSGKIAFRGGEWTAPVVTLGPEHILEHDLRQGVGALDRYNQLKTVYTDERLDFQPAECEPWEDLADQAERGVITADFAIDAVPSTRQARQLAKIRFAYDNPEWIGTVRTDLYGLLLRGETSGGAPEPGKRGRATVRLVIPELQIDGPFYVDSHELMAEKGLPVGCMLTVRSADPAAYNWTTAEEGANPAIPADTKPDGTLPVPQGLTLSVDRRNVTAATVVSVVLAEVDTPARADAQLEAQIRLSSSSAWESMAVASGSFEAVSGPLVDGETYVVRARFRFTGGAGDWTAESSITVVANPNPPATPSDFTAGLTAPSITLEWRNPSSNFYRAVVWRGTTSVFDDATEMAEVPGVAGELSTWIDASPASGTYYYWVTAINESDVPSATPAGPQSVTKP